MKMLNSATVLHESEKVGVLWENKGDESICLEEAHVLRQIFGSGMVFPLRALFVIARLKEIDGWKMMKVLGKSQRNLGSNPHIRIEEVDRRWMFDRSGLQDLGNELYYKGIHTPEKNLQTPLMVSM